MAGIGAKRIFPLPKTGDRFGQWTLYVRLRRGVPPEAALTRALYGKAFA